MEINEFNYIFKERDSKEIALNVKVIYENLGYSKIDKNKISTIFNLTEYDTKEDLCKTSSKIDIANNLKKGILADKCNQLQQKWDEYKKEYFNIISKVFDITINPQITTHTYCYLQLLPINEIDLKDNIIYLDANKEVEDMFKTFIILLTKAILLNRWNYINNWDFNTEFDAGNRIWMFAELAIDAIFNNCELYKICKNPTYKYFYSLNLKNENIMEYFRKIYKSSCLDEFFTEVYMFVHDNYKDLLQFRHYLY